MSSFFESPAFVAMISGVVLILVSGVQALLSYLIGRRLVDQAAQARQDEATRIETEWGRANRAAHVTAIETFVEECIRSLSTVNEWANAGDWSQRIQPDAVVSLTMSRQRSLSAAAALDPTDGLGKSIRALYQFVFDASEAYRSKKVLEVYDIFGRMIVAADEITASLASTRAR